LKQLFFFSFFNVQPIFGSAWSFVFFIPATTANDLRLRSISIPDLIQYIISYLNYNLNFIYFTTITKHHARWHRCLRSDSLWSN